MMGKANNIAIFFYFYLIDTIFLFRSGDLIILDNDNISLAELF